VKISEQAQDSGEEEILSPGELRKLITQLLEKTDGKESGN
jgi:hypothetical protein